jgi:hypothetical protein
MTADDLIRIARLSYANPRAGARAILCQNLPHAARWQALILLAVILTLIGAMGEWAMPATDMPVPQFNYFGVAVVHAVLLAVPAGLIHIIGDRTGSNAGFMDALVIVLWLQTLLLPLQLTATLALAIGPTLAQAIILMFAGVTFWLLTNFVTELHGYRSRLNVFLGILTVSIVLALLMLPFLDPNFG